MNQQLTMAEIRDRFDAEWVLLEDPITTRSLEIKGGRVLFHSPDRDAAHRQVVETKPKRFAVLFIGQIPENTAVVL